MAIESTVAIIGAVVSIASATVAGILGYLSIRNAKLSQYAQAQKEAADAYDRMVSFRVAHPRVMQLSRDWTPDCFRYVYLQTPPNENDEWVTYYSYVELCIGYCNAVLSARDQRLLSESSFSNHHKLLVKLLLTEHNPIITNLLEHGKYISMHVRRFRDELAAQGWNWNDEHNDLI